MSYDQIITCLEQKKVLLTKILDLTKQIEVHCRQPEIVLDDLLDKRGVYINRFNKCNDLISNLIKQLPKDQQERMQLLFDLKVGSMECTQEENKIEKLTAECSTIVQRATIIDNNAREELQKQYNEIKVKIKDSRVKDGNMFYL